MIVYDKNIFGTNREVDGNGFLRVDANNITKTQVAPYLGREIPHWKDFGLEAEKVYYVLRPEDELKKAVKTFNNLPLTRKHIEVDVDNVPKEDIIGSMGDSAEFSSPYIKNSLIVYDKKEIEKILSGKKKELSCGYTYTPIPESGEFDGKHYDFKMTDIVGNHVALVKEGRAGHDVMVSDTIERVKEKIMGLFRKKEITEDKKLSETEQEKVGVVMKEFKEGELKSGSGEKVTDPKQAIAIALSEAGKSKDEIPEKQDEPEKAGEESALNNGEQKMEEKSEEVLVEDKCSAKDEEKDLKGKEKEAFAEGVEYGEEKEKEEPKKLDSEHESEGEEKALKKEEEAKDEDKKEEKKEEKVQAKDEAMVMDIDSIKAEAREEGRQEAIADYKAREVARKAVRKVVGDVDVFAFDSAEEIYKFACEKSGVDLTDVASYKDVFKGLSARKGGLAMDASPVSGSNEECLKDIRLS